jgi:acylphosphatase
MSRIRRVYVYSGRVQGVGFRYTVKNIALQYDVAGYVKNLPDGRVEVCIEGVPAEMDRMAEEVGRKMDGFIKDVRVEESPAAGVAGFSIKH